MQTQKFLRKKLFSRRNRSESIHCIACGFSIVVFPFRFSSLKHTKHGCSDKENDVRSLTFREVTIEPNRTIANSTDDKLDNLCKC